MSASISRNEGSQYKDATLFQLDSDLPAALDKPFSGPLLFARPISKPLSDHEFRARMNLLHLHKVINPTSKKSLYLSLSTLPGSFHTSSLQDEQNPYTSTSEESHTIFQSSPRHQYFPKKIKNRHVINKRKSSLILVPTSSGINVPKPQSRTRRHRPLIGDNIIVKRRPTTSDSRTQDAFLDLKAVGSVLNRLGGQTPNALPDLQGSGIDESGSEMDQSSLDQDDGNDDHAIEIDSDSLFGDHDMGNEEMSVNESDNDRMVCKTFPHYHETSQLTSGADSEGEIHFYDQDPARKATSASAELY